MGHNRKPSDMIRVNGQVRQILADVARTDTNAAYRARGILASGSTHMSRRVLNGMMRTIGA